MKNKFDIIGFDADDTLWLNQPNYDKVEDDFCELLSKNIDKEELESYLKQKPNRKVLELFRFHLSVYNLANRGKERKWKKK